MSKREEMYGLIEEWKISGKRQINSLEGRGINRHKLGYWLGKYRKEKQGLTTKNKI